MIGGKRAAVQKAPDLSEASLFDKSSFTWEFLFGYFTSFSAYLYLLFCCFQSHFLLYVCKVYPLFHILSFKIGG